jgi:hypothetical protein
LFKKAIEILGATVGIESNREKLLPSLPLKTEVKSLLTDFLDVAEIPYSDKLDGYIFIQDSEEKPTYQRSAETVKFKGPFFQMSQYASDRRFSLWGNQGFLYRFALYLLEKKHKIYNLHACALYQEEKDELYVITGGAGSGKTVYLLSGLSKGAKLFSTETVHFRISGDEVTWFMGSLLDNVRWGTLIHDFPQFLPDLETPQEGKKWQKKIALDLSSYRTKFEKLANPRSITILFPRIEEGRQGFALSPMEDKRKTAKALFDNISQKLTETVILYDCMPFLGLEEKELASARLESVNNLVHHPSLALIASVLSNPSECWGNLLK